MYVMGQTTLSVFSPRTWRDRRSAREKKRKGSGRLPDRDYVEKGNRVNGKAGPISSPLLQLNKYLSFPFSYSNYANEFCNSLCLLQYVPFDSHLWLTNTLLVGIVDFSQEVRNIHPNKKC